MLVHSSRKSSLSDFREVLAFEPENAFGTKRINHRLEKPSVHRILRGSFYHFQYLSSPETFLPGDNTEHDFQDYAAGENASSPRESEETSEAYRYFQQE